MKQVKRVTAISALFLFAFCVQIYATETKIEDMPVGWSKNAVKQAVSEGWLTADQGKIYPERPLTRAELSAIINRIFNTEMLEDIDKYADVPKGSWYEQDMAKAVKMKALVGEGDKLYPQRKITRQEAFSVICRVLEMGEGDTSVLEKYMDGSSVASWARGSMAAMVEHGYVRGSRNELRPSAEITREEFAQLMTVITETVVTSPGEYTQNHAGNVLINCSGVTIKNSVVQGDLILCDGIGSGDIALENVTVNGRLVVRGGGKNTVKVIESKIKGDVVINNVNYPIHLSADAKTLLKKVIIKNEVYLDGTIENLTVVEKAEVTLLAGEIQNIEILSPADSSKVVVKESGEIKAATVYAKNAEFSGDGKVEAVLAKASGISVKTHGTQVTVEKGENILAGDVTVTEGQTVVVDMGKKSTTKDIKNKNKSGGGSSGGGSTKPDPGTNPGTDPGTNPGTDPGTNPGTDPGTNPGTDPGTNPTTEQWIDASKTGIMKVDFANYAVVALKLEKMKGENPSEYTYYVNGQKVDAEDISIVMKSKDNSVLVIKMLLQNNSGNQTLKLVRASQHTEVILTNLQ